MQDSLRNATVVITGATSGMGRATALAFARQGARLVLGGRHAGALAAVVAECQQLGAAALAVPVDIRDTAAVQHLTEAAKAFGGRVDLWVDKTSKRAPASGAGRKWLPAALLAGMAGVAAGFYAWRQHAAGEDYSYFGNGGQL